MATLWHTWSGSSLAGEFCAFCQGEGERGLCAVFGGEGYVNCCSSEVGYVSSRYPVGDGCSRILVRKRLGTKVCVRFAGNVVS